MTIAERIQSLRKASGISQEELAERIGVSRQAVSKWEGGQSLPDLEKIILLSDQLETTTDYLLKGIPPAPEGKRNRGPLLASIAGTILNGAGLIAAVAIWVERQTAYAVAIGLIAMLIGTGIFLLGQWPTGREQEAARRSFLLPNLWILPFIPLSCLFNLLDGVMGGFSGQLAPIPLLGNSLVSFSLYWILYLVFGIAATRALLKSAAKPQHV
ncbi:MAG TPA: helix-turn-helix domain-containing protein [Firmicutes bacterium]|nr:helix-turn-helix domain-containing protein [Bacillota bacterium]